MAASKKCGFAGRFHLPSAALFIVIGFREPAYFSISKNIRLMQLVVIVVSVIVGNQRLFMLPFLDWVSINKPYWDRLIPWWYCLVNKW